MARICYERPNRTTPRRYSEKDVIRIAKYAIQYGADWRKIIAGVLVAGGAVVFIERLGRMMESYAGILGAVGAGVISAATLVIIDRAIQLLSYGLIKKLPLINSLLIVLLAMSAYIKSLEQGIGSILGAGTINDIVDTLNFIVASARSIAGEE